LFNVKSLEAAILSVCLYLSAFNVEAQIAASPGPLLDARAPVFIHPHDFTYGLLLIRRFRRIKYQTYFLTFQPADWFNQGFITIHPAKEVKELE